MLLRGDQKGEAASHYTFFISFFTHLSDCLRILQFCFVLFFCSLHMVSQLELRDLAFELGS